MSMNRTEMLNEDADKVIELINNWNPAEIYPLLKDEYFPEIKKILLFIDESIDISVDSLARSINAIFIDAFGEKVYSNEIEKCKAILPFCYKTSP